MKLNVDPEVPSGLTQMEQALETLAGLQRDDGLAAILRYLANEAMRLQQLCR